MAINFDHQNNLINTSTQNLSVDTTGALKLPVGDANQQPNGVLGYIRWNTTTNKMEMYDGSQWRNLATETYVNATGGTLTQLTDTNISTPLNGQFLRYNSVSSQWENSDFSSVDEGDVIAIALALGG